MLLLKHSTVHGPSATVYNCSTTVCLQVEDQPVYEINLYVYLYFVVFAISCFYMLNFFLRFIMASLQKAKICIYVLVTVYVTVYVTTFHQI